MGEFIDKDELAAAKANGDYVNVFSGTWMLIKWAWRMVKMLYNLIGKPIVAFLGVVGWLVKDECKEGGEFNKFYKRHEEDIEMAWYAPGMYIGWFIKANWKDRIKGTIVAVLYVSFIVTCFIAVLGVMFG